VKSVRLVIALLALVALLGITGGVSAQPPGGPSPFDKLLGAFDANDDGALDEDEVPPWLWQRLSRADANGDGVVTRAEFDAYRKKLAGGK
jgi:EF hand